MHDFESSYRILDFFKVHDEIHTIAKFVNEKTRCVKSMLKYANLMGPMTIYQIETILKIVLVIVISIRYRLVQFYYFYFCSKNLFLFKVKQFLVIFELY